MRSLGFFVPMRSRLVCVSLVVAVLRRRMTAATVVSLTVVSLLAVIPMVAVTLSLVCVLPMVSVLPVASPVVPVVPVVVPLLAAVPLVVVAGLSGQVSTVAAEQVGVGSAERESVSDHHQLHLTLVNVDEHGRAALRVQQKDHGEQSHLKLRAGAHEGAAHWFDQAVPAELQVENVVVLVRNILFSGLETFVVQEAILLLQVELNPVVESNDFRTRLGLAHKDVLEA